MLRVYGCVFSFLPLLFAYLRMSSNPRFIAGVPFNSVGILRTTLLLRTTCMRSCCNWRAGCVAALQTKMSKVHCGSAVLCNDSVRRFQASLWRCNTCVIPAVLGGLAVWWHNNQKKWLQVIEKKKNDGQSKGGWGSCLHCVTVRRTNLIPTYCVYVSGRYRWLG